MSKPPSRRTLPCRSVVSGIVIAAALLAALGVAGPSTAAPIRAGEDGTATSTSTVTSPSAGEAGDLRWAVEPSTATGPTGRVAFVHDVQPGQIVDEVLGISNLAEEPQTFRVYGSDAFSTPDGSFALLRGDQASKDVGSWVGFGADTYTVPGNSRLDLPFKIRVPANATPGDHVGGAVAAVLDEGEPEDGQRVDIDRRVAARIYLRVSGPLDPEVTIERVSLDYDAPLNAISGAPARVTYRIRNSGNTRITGTVRVGVTGWLGIGASARPSSLPELLPGATIARTVVVDDVRPAVRLTAEVTVVPEDGAGPTGPAPERISRSASTWAIPWSLVAVAALGAAAWWRRRRRRSRRTRSTADGTTEVAAESMEVG